MKFKVFLKIRKIENCDNLWQIYDKFVTNYDAFVTIWDKFGTNCNKLKIEFFFVKLKIIPMGLEDEESILASDSDSLCFNSL